VSGSPQRRGAGSVRRALVVAFFARFQACQGTTFGRQSVNKMGNSA